MSTEPDDGGNRDLSRVLQHVLDVFAALQHQYREHTRLEAELETGARAQESREALACRRASARQALAASQAQLDQLTAEVERSIQQLRSYVL